MIDRGDYWQCGYSIPKASLEALQQAGLPSFLETLAEASPFTLARLRQEVTDWNRVKLLEIRIDRLQQ
ncbi:hypothetical protein J3D56_001871 [Erwinia persicina]|jgi:hypothetical protein|nr:hypothetical protein [Erwinia persicina]